jgi:hypothetical protein
MNHHMSKQQARSVERVQNSFATIIVLIAAAVAIAFAVRGCEDEHRGWPSDAHASFSF